MITLDLSSAYDMIDHQQLLFRLQHLGLNEKAINIIRSFLKERRQYVETRGSQSNILVTGPSSVIRGSIMSSSFYLLYILDLPLLLHPVKHSTIDKYRKCTKPITSTFVDDLYSIVYQKKNINIWITIKKHIQLYNEYFNNNMLRNNQDKTKVMLITKNKRILKHSILLEGKRILKLSFHEDTRD